MSKKKISQIVGLTIGATAIAATGIGSSIALTSCTGEQQVASVTNFTLGKTELDNAFASISSLLESSANKESTFNDLNADDLNSNLKQLIFIETVANKIAENQPGFDNSCIKEIDFTVVNKDKEGNEVDATAPFIQSKEVVASIIFNDNVTIDASSLDGTNLSVDGVNAQQVDNATPTVLTNPQEFVLNYDQTVAQAIQEGVK